MSVASVFWAFLALNGFWFITMGRHVLVSPDWEDGDWWVLTSWVALRGLLFAVLFPVVRTDHTRAQERTNALWVILWGVTVSIIGISMVFYERSH